MPISNRSCRILVLGASSALAAFPVAAQNLTAEDITEVFNKQLEVREAPLTRSLGGGQLTRRLDLFTVEDIQAVPVTEESLAAESGSDTSPGFAPITDSLNGGAIAAADSSGVSSTTGQGTAPLASSGTVQPLAAPSATASEPPATTTVAAAKPVDQNKPLVYARLDPELQINLDIKFAYDSAALDNAQKAKLSTMCAAMQASPVELFRIIGHTDTSGSDAYNQSLSVLRAKEVARHLVQDCGIAAARLEIVGMGERFPLNEQNTRADENRRVEFQAMS